MGRVQDISILAVIRLTRYHRQLGELIRKGVSKISSEDFSKVVGSTSSQIRLDLHYFGAFGRKGYGYDVRSLYNDIGNILGIGRNYSIAIVGAGNIAQSILNYKGFEDLGFIAKGVFDINPKLIGMKIRELEIQDIDYLPEFLGKNQIDIGIICTPGTKAQVVCDCLVENGVKGIWNFSPVDLQVNEKVRVTNVHLDESLLTLKFLMNQRNSSGVHNKMIV